MINIDTNKIIAKLNELGINEKEKKLFLDLFQKIQSPVKFKYDTLDEKLKPFFYRGKEYYLALENYFKNSVSNLEMIKKFLYEFSLRVKTKHINDLRNIKLLSLIFIYEKLKSMSLFGNEYDAIKEKFNSFDKINHYYPLQYNTYLFQRFFYDFLMERDDYFTLGISSNCHYVLDESYFKFLMENENKLLENLKILIEKYDVNDEKLSLNELLNKATKDIGDSEIQDNELNDNEEIDILDVEEIKFTNNDYLRYKIKAIQEYIKSENKFLKYINFFEFLDTLNKKDKLELIEIIKEILNGLSILVGDNLKLAIKNIRETDYPENIKEAFIQYLIDTHSYRQFLTFDNSVYPNPKKFYFELDFSLPEDLVIEQIKSLYKEYKRGNIKTFEEFALNKQVKKYSYLEELQNNYIFKIKDEKKIPLYVKLVDLIYILDMWLINMKNIIVIRNIEKNRLNYDDNSYKSFESTYKKYKNFIIDFYINDKFKNYL